MRHLKFQIGIAIVYKNEKLWKWVLARRCFEFLELVLNYMVLQRNGLLRTVYKLVWSSKCVRTNLTRIALSAMIVAQYPGE